jgi:threonine dehydratase
VSGVDFNILNRDEATQEKIRGEGAEVIVHEGEYDDCLLKCRQEAEETGALLILDTSFEGYTEIPQVCSPVRMIKGLVESADIEFRHI